MRSSRDSKALVVGIVLASTLLLAQGAFAQARAGIPRRPDGKPNLNGIWQAINTANWDVQTHGAAQGPFNLGAIGAIPPGLGVVEGDEIPYLPAALAK